MALINRGGVSDDNKDTGSQYRTNDVPWDDWGDPADQTRSDIADPDNPLFDDNDPDPPPANDDPVDPPDPTPDPPRNKDPRDQNTGNNHNDDTDTTDTSWFDNQTTAGAEACTTTGYVNVGDVIFVWGSYANSDDKESNVSGVDINHVTHMNGSDGGHLAIYVANSSGTVSINTTDTADIVHTGDAEAVGVKNVNVSHSPQNGSTGVIMNGMSPGDVFLEWDEDDHGGKKRYWSFTGRSNSIGKLDCGNHSRSIREVTAAGDFSRDKEEWVEETAIRVDLSYVHEPLTLTATPNVGPKNHVAWTYVAQKGAYLIEQPSMSDPKIVKPVGGNVNVERFYSYDDPEGASMNPPVDILEYDVSKIFLYSFGSRVSLVIVHDKPNGGDEDQVDFSFQGMPNAAQWVIQDDDSEPTSWTWYNCCTDGGVLRGGLDSPFSIDLTPNFIDGISSWVWLDDSYGNEISLNMSETLNIRRAQVNINAYDELNPDQFIVERKEYDADGTPEWQQIANVGGDQREYIDMNVTTGIEYEYRVRAADSDGNASDPSPVDRADPSRIYGATV